MSDAVIVRSRQLLSHLVAQHVTKIFSADVLARNFDLAPDYTTWAGVDLVIRNREDAGYQWRIQWVHQGQWDGYVAELRVSTAGDSLIYSYSRYARSAPIALCLAALDSVGCRVRLELGDSND